VETDDEGAPTTITISGRRHRVDCVREEWMIQDQWWTAEPVAQRCIDLVLDSGRQLEIRHQHSTWTILQGISSRTLG
jgi:hypothetical protein